MQEEDVLQTPKKDSPVHEEPANIVANTSRAASSAKRNAATQSSVSGLYTWKKSVGDSSTTPADSEVGEMGISEELRLDVDGRYPQMVASGVIHGGIFSRVHWIAKLIAGGSNTWAGDVFYTEGKKSSFPYKSVTIQVEPNATPTERQAQVLLSGGGATNRSRVFQFASPNFHTVDFEFDFVEGEKVLMNIKTGAHPNRPTSLRV